MKISVEFTKEELIHLDKALSVAVAHINDDDLFYIDRLQEKVKMLRTLYDRIK